jgi:hypothetical protein
MYNYDTTLKPISIFLRSSDSSNANNTAKNNELFELNSTIISYPNVDMLISLKSFCFTNSFYTINQNNCYLYYTFDNIIIHAFLVELGNYNIDELITYLNAELLGIFTFSYNLKRLKVTILSTDNTPFRLCDGLSNINEMLGFDTEIPYTTLFIQFTAPYVFNMIGVQLLHICTNINLESVQVKSYINYNILDTIQIICGKGETQSYSNSNSFCYKVKESNITNISISIYDQDFNVVNFNNIDWFININFNFVYEKKLIQAEYLYETTMKLEEARQLLIEQEKRNILMEYE